MLHDHMINFFEAAVVFLLLTNSASLASSCAMRLMHSFAYAKRDIKRKLDLILGAGLCNAAATTQP